MLAREVQFAGDGSREREELRKLIMSATRPERGKVEVPHEVLCSIKRLVRLSDTNVDGAFEVLSSQLRQKNSQVRYLTLLILDELFHRSKRLRSLLLDDFQVRTG